MLILIIINSTNTQNSIGYADTSQNSDIALSENAKLCEDESVMLLSKNDAYKVGGFWLKQPVSMKNGVTITFDYKMTGVGDGFAVGYSSEMKEIKNNTPNVMGLPIDEDSMVIEFDGYKNDFDPSAPNNKHIGVNKDVSTHLATGYTTKINDDIWHSAKILMTGEGIIVIIDNTVSLYYKSKINLLEKGFIGFCAFNGEYRSDYYIKNYAVSQSASLDGFDYNENRLSYNSHIYEIVDRGKITYGEAKAYCISQGGHLATITSQEENDAVYQYLVSKGHMSAYFGLEEEQEGVWRWVNGEELSYLNWGGGEPNNANGNESYGMFYKNYLDGKWNDGGFLNGCTSYDVSTFICEWDSAEDYSGSGASPELQKEFVQKHIDFAASPQYQNRQNENLIKNYTDAILSKKAGAAARVWKYIMKAPTILTDWEEYLENPYRAVLATLFLKEDYLANYNRAFEEGCEAKIQKTASLIMKYLQQTDIQLSESEIRELESCLLTKHKELNNSELGKKVSEKIGRFSQSQLETLFSDLDYYTGLAQETIDFWSRIKKAMEYDAAYQSYKENEKELKDTLTAMATTAALYYKESKDTRYALIQDAALDYIGTSNDEEAKKVAQKFVDSGIELTGNLIIDEIISKVSDYISSSAASGSAGAGVAKVAAAVKVGYDVGMAIDELLLNNTKVSNNFEYLRACACMEDLLCNILQGEEANMKSKQTYSSALLFHQTYIIYSTVQKYGIDLMIQTSNLDLEDDYGSKIFSWITHIYTDKQANEIVGMYNLCAKKADYMKMLCCDKEFGNGRKGKIAVIACPIDVTVTDAAGNIVAQVVDNKVVGKTSDDVEICCSAGVKYLYLASDKYDLKLEATDSGKMSYFVYGFNQDGIMESRSGYAELPIKKGEIYNGKVSCVEEQTAISADLEKDNKVVEGKQDLSGDSLQQCKIDVQAESGGTAIGSKSCVVGDVVAIAAYPDAGYRFAGWYINNQIVAKTEKYIFHAAENTSVKAAFVPVEEKTNPTIPDRVAVNQSITANSRTVAYGTKPFALNAQAKTNLTYTSSNTKVATVSGAGKVTIKGTGKAVITITAEATENYNAASKQVTITVTPKKASGLKVKTAKKKMTVSWKKDTRASGYQITYAQNKKFTKGKKSVTVSKNKTTKKTIKKLKSKKTYYVKVRAYKKSGSTKLYGSYSKVKKAKVK